MKVCSGTNFGTIAQHLQTAVSIMNIKGGRHHADDLVSLLHLCTSGFTFHSLYLKSTMLIGIERGREMAHTSITLISFLMQVIFPFIGTCSPSHLLTTYFELSPTARGE